jgi:hypothetical protein
MIIIFLTITSDAILVGKLSIYVLAMMYSVFPGMYRAFIMGTTIALNFEKFGQVRLGVMGCFLLMNLELTAQLNFCILLSSGELCPSRFPN